MSQCDTYDEQQEKSSGMLCFVDTPVVTYLDVREDLPRVGLVCVQWYLQTRSSNNVEGLWLSVNPLRASQLRGSEFNGILQFVISYRLRKNFSFPTRKSTLCDSCIGRSEYSVDSEFQ